MRFPRLLPVLVVVLLSLAVAGCNSRPASAVREEITVLVSIDGFRWDYLQLHHAPVLAKLAAEGVHATRITPCFPSKTFPNHYSLVTGLRPESHGIVANWFYDPKLKEMFAMSKKETHWWDGGEPVWITAEKQGVRSACFFWPGSEAELQGRRPTYYKPWDKRLTSNDRVDGLLEWLGKPEAERPRLCTLYFDAVDTAGHNYGPTAPETKSAVAEVDAAIGRLLAGLERLGLRDRVNLLVVSDHGMGDCGPDRVIFFEDLMDVSKVQLESNGPNGGVRPKPGTVTPAELAASIRAKAPPQLKVYLREEVPAEFHYGKSDRIPPVVLMCDMHWNIETKNGWPLVSQRYSRGAHGWDPRTTEMGALFIARGPAFRTRLEIGDVENIHLYNLLCATVGITPAPNEGDDRLLRQVMR